MVVGASTGSDAHTVGIDAIMNMKGFAGHYGLERYDMVEALNMGSQVPNEEFIAKAIEMKADILLVSQTVTQKDIHIKNLVELSALSSISLCSSFRPYIVAALSPAMAAECSVNWALFAASALERTAMHSHPGIFSFNQPRHWARDCLCEKITLISSNDFSFDIKL